jgi:TPR repeat protein
MILAILIAAIAPATTLQKSCKAGKGDACDELGNRYRLSLGVKPSETKAADFYRLACKAKSAEGCADDVFAQTIGLGQPKTGGAGIAKLEAMCKDKNMRACGRLGHLIHEAMPPNGDRERGEKLMTDACKGGDLESCLNLSIIYWQLGDKDASQKYGKAACDNDFAEGCANQGDYAILQRDLVTAATLFQHACDLGSTRGCRDQALMLLEAGINLQKALQLLDHNCQLNDEASCEAARTARDDAVSKPKPAPAPTPRK